MSMAEAISLIIKALIMGIKVFIHKLFDGQLGLGLLDLPFLGGVGINPTFVEVPTDLPSFASGLF